MSAALTNANGAPGAKGHENAGGDRMQPLSQARAIDGVQK